MSEHAVYEKTVAQVTALQAENKQLTIAVRSAWTAHARAEDEVVRLRTALAQYANPAKWGHDNLLAFDFLWPHRHFHCASSGWQIAAAALKGKETSK